jgi:ribosomal protein S24E
MRIKTTDRNALIRREDLKIGIDFSNFPSPSAIAIKVLTA